MLTDHGAPIHDLRRLVCDGGAVQQRCLTLVHHAAGGLPRAVNNMTTQALVAAMAGSPQSLSSSSRQLRSASADAISRLCELPMRNPRSVRSVRALEWPVPGRFAGSADGTAGGDGGHDWLPSGPGGARALHIHVVKRSGTEMLCRTSGRHATSECDRPLRNRYAVCVPGAPVPWSAEGL